MPPRRTNARNVNARNANTAPSVLDQEISNVEFRNDIQILAQSMTNQKNRVYAPFNENGRSVVARVPEFVRMNLPEFLGSQTNEDPNNFLDEIKKIFKVMKVSGNYQIELALYRFKDVSHFWYAQWKENRGANLAYFLSKTFLGRFFPIELREAKDQEFINLRQGNMIVQEYGLKFTQL